MTTEHVGIVREELDIRPNVFMFEDEYRIYEQKWQYMGDKNGGYSRHPQGRTYSWDLYLVQGRKIGSFPTLEALEEFLNKRLNPPVVPEKIYTDICRCGCRSVENFYAITNGIVWEYHSLCGNPLRHADMVDLNRPLIKDVDLDDFLNF